MIWGVAGGLAEHVGFNPTLVRVFFVVTSSSEGPGCSPTWCWRSPSPRTTAPASPCPRASGRGSARWCWSASWSPWALFLAAGLAVVSAWVTATGHGTVIAIAVIVFGLGLVAAAFAGDIRRRIVPLLVVAGLVLGSQRERSPRRTSTSTNPSASARTPRPTVADIPADGYRLGTGQLIVDLRELPWTKGQTIPVSAHLGIGQMIVSVPPNVCIDGDVHGKAGELHLRRPGRPRGRPGHRPGLTAHRCTHASRSTPISSSGRC